jgi:hypothetical protein
MKKILISILTALFIIGSNPVQAQDKIYGDIYTYEYVYDIFGKPKLNADRSNLITRVRHTINSIDEYEFWLDNNFNNPVFVQQ